MVITSLFMYVMLMFLCDLATAGRKGECDKSEYRNGRKRASRYCG